MDDRVAAACTAWGLVLDERAQSGTNEVWFARRGGGEHVVLKVGDAAARLREAGALASYRSSSIRVLEHDRAGAMLLERVLLGDDLVPLSRIDDDAATAVIGGLMASLHGEQRGPEESQLPDLRDLAEVFDRPSDPRLDARLVRRASALFTELASGDRNVVLHGDLHHANVLRRGVGDEADEWVAIDPHGWWGDPVFDTATMLANPRGIALDRDVRDPDAVRRQAFRRVAILSEATGYDRERIVAWAFVGGVVAEQWMLDDHDLVHGGPLALAQVLATCV